MANSFEGKAVKKLTPDERGQLRAKNSQLLVDLRLFRDELDMPTLYERTDEGSRRNNIWLTNYIMLRISGADEDKCKEHLDTVGQNSSLLASKFRGALLGLALGDALGTTLEFSARDSKPKVTELIGGGPFNLKPGQWTDDTSMALCLAHSLVRCESSSVGDQIKLYWHWWREGAFSVNGECFDIGNTVMSALHKYETDKTVYAGSTSPDTAGNGSLMRLAPAALFAFSSPKEVARICGESSRTTHGAVEAIDACRYFGVLIHGAIRGVPKHKLTTELYTPTKGMWDGRATLAPSVVKAALNAHKKTRDQIKSSGYVIDTLEAAIWAFHHTDNFEDGAILAVNLAGDADTVGAVYGQLAGAYYGEMQINPEWIRKLAKFHIFYLYADKLLRFGVCDMLGDSNVEWDND